MQIRRKKLEDSSLIASSSCSLFQVWFQNRRAKWRKKEHTKKGPGRPAHNAHPQSCSGEPIPPEELRRKERERRQKKLLKALERQQRKLAAKVSTRNLIEIVKYPLMFPERISKVISKILFLFFFFIIVTGYNSGLVDFKSRVGVSNSCGVG